MTKPLKVIVDQSFDSKVTELFPFKSSGDNSLHSQHQFTSEALPLIIETFSIYLESMHMHIPDRGDYRVASFEDLLVPEVSVFAYEVFHIGSEPDQVHLYDLRITSKLEICEGEILE